jgi:hypothetical protein
MAPSRLRPLSGVDIEAPRQKCCCRMSWAVSRQPSRPWWGRFRGSTMRYEVLNEPSTVCGDADRLTTAPPMRGIHDGPPHDGYQRDGRQCHQSLYACRSPGNATRPVPPDSGVGSSSHLDWASSLVFLPSIISPTRCPMPDAPHRIGPLGHDTFRGSNYVGSLTSSPSAGAGCGSSGLSAICREGSPIPVSAWARRCFAWSRRATFACCFCRRACSF